MNLKTKQTTIFLIFTFLVSLTTFSQVKLPKLISDGMVLQQDTEVKIWGWAAIHEKISLSFHDSIYQTTANDSGEWDVKLPNLKAGGPYTMTIMSSDTVTIKNILIGDVWICSGQSNMELPMKRVSPIYEHEIANSDNTYIRCFTVPQRFNFNEPQKDLVSGIWQAANPKNVLDFSATAYFFAKELYEKYQVPIGLINTSLGGSPAEAWISEGSLKAFPEHYKEAQRFKDSTLINKIENQDKMRIQAWHNELRKKDEGYKDPRKIWNDPTLNTSDWATMKIPGYWTLTQLGHVNGVVWFKKEINIPAFPDKVGIDSPMAEQRAKLILGRIVDSDSVFVNGVFVGTTGYQYPPRRYSFPSDLLKEGQNAIVVRVISESGHGGFVLDKHYELITGGQTIDLKGDWQYRLGATMDPLASQTFIRWKPLGLYNAMISPLLNYAMKGVIWYQGESNAERPIEYEELLPALIRDWRKNWNQGDFPFLFVQLPNYMEAKKQPSESNWALLREAQLKTLSLPNTGMAVAIDIGEWNDIHPLNKKDVGKRLALAAQKVAYHDNNVVYSGPLYHSMKIIGNKVILSFTNIGSGLVAQGGAELTNFAIAGNDKKFIWAKALLKGNKVVVWNSKVQKPKAVRYAWADNPLGANLYNREGLPASPFRTDE
jgi:sialate O-acetylesterase